MAVDKLTEKQERYCQLRSNGSNKSDAYRGAYKTGKMKPPSIHRSAHQLELDPKITSRIDTLRAAKERRTQVTTDKVLMETQHLAFSDIRDLFGADGEILAPHLWPDDISKAVAGVDITEIRRGSEVQKFYKVKLWPKNPAIDKLMRHMGMFEKDNNQRNSFTEALKELTPELREDLANEIRKIANQSPVEALPGAGANPGGG